MLVLPCVMYNYDHLNCVTRGPVYLLDMHKLAEPVFSPHPTSQIKPKVLNGKYSLNTILCSNLGISTLTDTNTIDLQKKLCIDDVDAAKLFSALQDWETRSDVPYK